ncbi:MULTISPECIES: DMT family transporter [Prauserella salsuginis group]|uniref:DMT family transporter n=1 Tax=Prauserella salsuginis TaxID=387889 RepID=A0ABW6GBB7_9PSEU|nr:MULTISPECIES: DMT family transporter [Prauserella salsuginis group]MCR3722434.1 Permease of the drug/metabolite transporter (DMT) superfamily [Prauserella flava]MCR3736876.1 Permease of the drug/metabolite transporter (DMT) superfamily [Prauserella salsuginis]
MGTSRTDTGLAVGFVLLWSSGFIGATMGTALASSATLLAWRFAAVTALLGLWWLVFRRRRIPLRDLGVHALLGLLTQVGYLSGVVWSAELGVPAGTSALIAALQPIVAAALSGPLLGEHTSATQWLGLVLGLGGVALVVSGDLAGSAPALAYTLPLLAMLSLVAGTFAQRRLPSRLSLPESLLIQAALSAVVFLSVAGFTGETAPPMSGEFWFAIAWLVVLSTFGGYGFYWAVARRGSVRRVSTLLYLTPPTTMLAALLMFGEPVTVQGLAGLVVCFGAVLLALRSPREMSAPRATMEPCTETPCTTKPGPPTPCASTTSSAPPASWPPRDHARPRPRSLRTSLAAQRRASSRPRSRS